MLGLEQHARAATGGSRAAGAGEDARLADQPAAPSAWTCTTRTRAASEDEQRLYLLSAWRRRPYTPRERAALAWPRP